MSNLVNTFGGRFTTVNIENSKLPRQSVLARFVRETPQYVDLELINENRKVRRVKKSSIVGAHSGPTVL
jgi:hypothetical protein